MSAPFTTTRQIPVEGGLLRVEVELSSWAGIPLMLHRTVNKGRRKWTCAHEPTGAAAGYGHSPEQALGDAIPKLRADWFRLDEIFAAHPAINPHSP